MNTNFYKYDKAKIKSIKDLLAEMQSNVFEDRMTIVELKLLVLTDTVKIWRMLNEVEKS